MIDRIRQRRYFRGLVRALVREARRREQTTGTPAVVWVRELRERHLEQIAGADPRIPRLIPGTRIMDAAIAKLAK